MAFIENKEKLVQLTYSFIFSRRDNIWNNIFDFEHDLAQFLKSKGLEAESITFVEGSSGNRTLYIRDVSKDMKLRNDKDIFKTQNFPNKVGRPIQKSSSLTNQLVGNMGKFK